MLKEYSDNIINKLDDKIDSAILSLKELADFKYCYSVENLNDKINDEETLLDYIRDTEKEFMLPEMDVFNMTDVELSKYVQRLDRYWRE